METWKIVPGSDCNYEVSDLGNVRNAATKKPLNPYWQGRYLAFTIHKSGKRNIVRLHCAVLEAFRGIRPVGSVGAHCDGDTANCRLSNLRWATPAENEADKLRHGTDACGEKSVHARFTNSEAALIRKAYAKGLSLIDLARLTRVNTSTIHLIVKGETYRQVSSAPAASIPLSQGATR